MRVPAVTASGSLPYHQGWDATYMLLWNVVHPSISTFYLLHLTFTFLHLHFLECSASFYVYILHKIILHSLHLHLHFIRDGAPLTIQSMSTLSLGMGATYMLLWNVVHHSTSTFYTRSYYICYSSLCFHYGWGATYNVVCVYSNTGRVRFSMLYCSPKG